MDHRVKKRREAGAKSAAERRAERRERRKQTNRQFGRLATLAVGLSVYLLWMLLASL